MTKGKGPTEEDRRRYMALTPFDADDPSPRSELSHKQRKYRKMRKRMAKAAKRRNRG